MRLKRMDWRNYTLLQNRHKLFTPILSPLPEVNLQITRTNAPADELIDPDEARDAS